MSHPPGGMITPQSARVMPIADWRGLEPLLARYDLVGELGRGGMGIVYKAVDRETGDTVAIKGLDARLAADPTTAERLKDEVRLARRITHRNVCRVHEFNRSGPLAYLTMEFVDGESLRSLLARVSRVPVAEAVRIARQVCAALAEAHATGIVHRDLKPENLMLDRTGLVKVLDFGVARLADANATTTIGGPLGTPAYMAPEQAQGHPVDGRADLYALGLVLYEMLVGRAAFTGRSALAVALKHLYEAPPRPSTVVSDVPAALDAVVLRCLEKDPARRWASAADLDAALADAAPMAKLTPAGAPTPAGAMRSPVEDGKARASGRLDPLGSWRRRAAVAIVVLVVAVAAAVYQLASRKTLRPPARVSVPIHEVTLPNGLRVLVSEDRRTPTCTVAIGYRAGNSVDEPGRTGLAHLFEHLMFQGSERAAAGEHLALASVYGEANGMTDVDYVVFFQRMPANQLELALFLEADRLHSLALDERRFSAERQVVIEERRELVDNAPFGRAVELLHGAAYDRFAYRHLPLGSVDDLQRATLKDAQVFYERYFSPGNAVLVIVGNIEPTRTLETVARYFGGIRGRPAPPPVDLAEPARARERRVTATDPFVSTSNLYVAYQGPTGETDDWYTLAALACILGQGRAARLHQKLVREAEVASVVSAAMQARRGPALLVLTVGARPGADVGAIERAVLAEIERIKTEGVTSDELQRARRQVERERALQFQTSRGRALALVDAALRFGDASVINAVEDRYGALTAEAVREAAARYLADHRRSVVVISPAPGRAPSVRRPPGEGTRLSGRETPLDVERKGLAPVSSTPLVVRFPPTVASTLANGLTVILVVDRRVPLVTGQIDLRGAGALFDPRELPGLAQATARMLPEGTTARTGRQVAELLEGHGATLTVSAPFGSAATTLSFSGLSSTFDAWFPLVAEVLRHPAFAPDALNALKAQLRSSIATSLAQASFVARMALARRIFGDHPAAVAVANRVLGEGPASRLFRRLRSRGDAYSVSSTFTALGYPGVWNISVDVRPAAVHRSIQTVLEELDRLGQEPVPPHELRESQHAVVAAFALSLEDLEWVVRYAATRELYGFSPDYWDSYPAKIVGVSAADVAHVARKYLNPRAVQLVAAGELRALARALTPFGPVVTAAPDARPARTPPAPPRQR